MLRWHHVSTACALMLLVACGDSADPGAGAAGSAGSSGGSGAAGSGAGGSTGGSSAAGSGGGSNGGGTSGGAGGTSSGGSGNGTSAEPTPKAEHIPKPHGPCPEFVGPEITLQPEQGPRTVKLWISEAADTLDGPLVFNWHGWHGSPGPGGIDTTSREQLLAMGGLLVSPYIEPTDEDKYWDMDDVLLADEVVGCAIEKVGIDLRRIYSTGLSAGGRQSLLLAYQRSGYISAIVTYSPGTSSGSLIAQDPTSKFAALISHGGSTEDAIFQQLAEHYFDKLTGAGHFVVLCQHTAGHSAPSALRTVAFDFLMAHPFGTAPSPYASSLPAAYPTYCGFTK
jgi:predicted esterase